MERSWLKQVRSRLPWLASFLFLVFVGYLLRPSLFGFDSYAHLNFVFFGFDAPLLNQPAANFVFGLFPDSLLFIKLFMVVAAVVSMVAVFCIVKFFFEERLAWLSLLCLVGLSPIVLLGFGEFENELLAYPFILWGLYFLFTKRYAFFVAFEAAGLLFWKWTWYFLWFQSTGSRVIEMNLFHGLLDFWFLLPFVVGIVFLKKRSVGLMWLGLVCVGLVLWNSKFFVFLLPFLALSIAQVIKLVEEGTLFGKKAHEYLKFVYLLAFFGIVGWNITYWLSSPSQNDWNILEFALKQSSDLNLPIKADTGYDYWITFKAQKEILEYQQLWEEKDFNSPVIWVTSSDSNCTLLTTASEFGKQKKVYQC